MAVSISAYVFKIYLMKSSCVQCKGKLVFDDEDNEHDHGKHLQFLSSGGLTVQSLALTEVNFPTYKM